MNTHIVKTACVRAGIQPMDPLKVNPVETGYQGNNEHPGTHTCKRACSASKVLSESVAATSCLHESCASASLASHSASLTVKARHCCSNSTLVASRVETCPSSSSVRSRISRLAASIYTALQGNHHVHNTHTLKIDAFMGEIENHNECTQQNKSMGMCTERRTSSPLQSQTPMFRVLIGLLNTHVHTAMPSVYLTFGSKQDSVHAQFISRCHTRLYCPIAVCVGKTSCVPVHADLSIPPPPSGQSAGNPPTPPLASPT